MLGVYHTYSPSPSLAAAKAQKPLIPHKTPGAGAEPQYLVNGEISGGPESLIGVRRLSISR